MKSIWYSPVNTPDINQIIPILRKQVLGLDVPWLENMVRQDRQKRDPFKVLISCILSLRTQDKTTG
ncbi:MAG: hypothetical protein AB1499_15055, partial [Nitrospirota bacterium]